MNAKHIVGWVTGLMVLSIVLTGIAPSATTILFAMTFIGIGMIVLVVGVMRAAPAGTGPDDPTLEHNYSPPPEAPEDR